VPQRAATFKVAEAEALVAEGDLEALAIAVEGACAIWPGFWPSPARSSAPRSWSPAGAPPSAEASPPETACPEPGLTRGGLGDAGDLLDSQARPAYQRRLDELEREIDGATTLRDPERRARAEAERELLRRELARGFGIDGRERRACAAAERARTAVRRAIKTALGRIAAAEAGRASGAQRPHRHLLRLHLPDPQPTGALAV
jgi:hypothetical protein